MSLFDRVKQLLSDMSGRAQEARGRTVQQEQTQRADGFPTEGVITERVTAERDEEFVVFHIGMRINNFWKVHRWLPILLVAPRMVRELTAEEESGLLESRGVVGPGIRHIGFVQYWDSFADLRAYARDSDHLHLPAWQEYYQDGTKDDACLGIWHETYVVDPDDCETVYNNMPRHGLGASQGTEIRSAVGQRDTASGRIGESEDAESRTEPGNPPESGSVQ